MLGIALVVNFLVAALVGSLIPLILRWLRADPAVASSVFVTACTDMCGFFVFLGLLSIGLRYFGPHVSRTRRKRAVPASVTPSACRRSSFVP